MTFGTSAGAVRAPARRSNTATATTHRDHAHPQITAGQRPGPDFWHATGQAPAALSARELLRRTGPPDGADRGHRPDADLRGVASAPGACPVCLPLQHRTAASGASVAPAAPDSAASRAGPWR